MVTSRVWYNPKLDPCVLFRAGCPSVCREAAGDREPHAGALHGCLHPAFLFPTLPGAAQETWRHGSGAAPFPPPQPTPYQLHRGAATQLHVAGVGGGARVHGGRVGGSQYPASLLGGGGESYYLKGEFKGRGLLLSRILMQLLLCKAFSS